MSNQLYTLALRIARLSMLVARRFASERRAAGSSTTRRYRDIQTVEADMPPMRLLLVRAVLPTKQAKIKSLCHDFESWAAVAVGGDFPTT